LVKLTPMNWVEKRADKEQAIRANAEYIWNRLVRSLEDAVNSYNRRYPDLPIREWVPNPPQFEVVITKMARQVNGFGVPEPRRIGLRYRLQPAGSTFRIFPIEGGTISFELDADDNGRVFMREEQGDRRERTIEEASEAILERFLFEQD
jgi:hypothetical protein